MYEEFFVSSETDRSLLNFANISEEYTQSNMHKNNKRGISYNDLTSSSSFKEDLLIMNGIYKILAYYENIKTYNNKIKLLKEEYYYIYDRYKEYYARYEVQVDAYQELSIHFHGVLPLKKQSYFLICVVCKCIDSIKISPTLRNCALSKHFEKWILCCVRAVFL